MRVMGEVCAGMSDLKWLRSKGISTTLGGKDGWDKGTFVLLRLREEGAEKGGARKEAVWHGTPAPTRPQHGVRGERKKKRKYNIIVLHKSSHMIWIFWNLWLFLCHWKLGTQSNKTHCWTCIYLSWSIWFRRMYFNQFSWSCVHPRGPSVHRLDMPCNQAIGQRSNQ